MTTALDEFRSRWRRWLGQKTRIDKPTYITLLDSKWISWAQRVCDDAGLDYVPLPFHTSREVIKMRFLDAINHANMDDLRQLDGVYCYDLFERRYL